MVAFTHRTAKRQTFLKLRLPISASIWALRAVMWLRVCFKKASGCQRPHSDLRGMFEKISGRRFLNNSLFLNAEAPLWFLWWLALHWQAAGSEVECWQWTEVADRSPPRTQTFIAIQWPYRLNPFPPARALLMPGAFSAEDRLVFYITKSLPEWWFQWIQVRGFTVICCTQTHNKEEECWTPRPQLADSYYHKHLCHWSVDHQRHE